MCADSSHAQALGETRARVHPHKARKKGSSRVNEVLEFLKATSSRRQTLFCSSGQSLSSLPVSRRLPSILHVAPLSSLLPPFTWLPLSRDASQIRRPPSTPSPSLPLTFSWGTRSAEKKRKKERKWQMDTAHLKRVSAGFIIADHRTAWCQRVRGCLARVTSKCLSHQYASSHEEDASFMISVEHKWVLLRVETKEENTKTTPVVSFNRHAAWRCDLTMMENTDCRCAFNLTTSEWI